MNKSFQESNGTVLSTNWRAPAVWPGSCALTLALVSFNLLNPTLLCRKDIGAKQTEFIPPEGMVAKKYEF